MAFSPRNGDVEQSTFLVVAFGETVSEDVVSPVVVDVRVGMDVGVLFVLAYPDRLLVANYVRVP
jgi:hypothetical protein